MDCGVCCVAGLLGVGYEKARAAFEGACNAGRLGDVEDPTKGTAPGSIVKAALNLGAPVVRVYARDFGRDAPCTFISPETHPGIWQLYGRWGASWTNHWVLIKDGVVHDPHDGSEMPWPQYEEEYEIELNCLIGVLR